MLAVERVPHDEVSSYGVVAIDETASLARGVYKVRDLVEKPPKEEAPSDLAIIGRYILTPDIFPSLRETAKDRTGEIQLTNGLRHLLRSRPIYACEINGVRHDTGNKLGFLKAVVYFALRRPDLSGPFAEYSAIRQRAGGGQHQVTASDQSFFDDESAVLRSVLLSVLLRLLSVLLSLLLSVLPAPASPDAFAPAGSPPLPLSLLPEFVPLPVVPLCPVWPLRA